MRYQTAPKTSPFLLSREFRGDTLDLKNKNGKKVKKWSKNFPQIERASTSNYVWRIKFGLKMIQIAITSKNNSLIGSIKQLNEILRKQTSRKWGHMDPFRAGVGVALPAKYWLSVLESMIEIFLTAFKYLKDIS
jgi:hypothetical protein